MKCIQCQTDNNLKERTEHQGRCKNCGHPFVFEPTSMGQVKFTDPFFAKAIADISANGTLFFTPKQFLYFVDRRLRKGSQIDGIFYFLYIIANIVMLVFVGVEPSFILASIFLNIGIIFTLFRTSQSRQVSPKTRQDNARGLQLVGGFVLIAGIGVSLAILKSFVAFTVAVILGMLSIYLGTRQLKRQRGIFQSFLMTQNQLEEWLNRWEQVNGASGKMLPSPREENTETEVSPDITAYSFDRVVVCDNAAVAQMLIANNFHFENNCAVLSITGYPPGIFTTVFEMLKRNPQLKVYALHDASPRGVRLVHHLRTSQNWFADSTVTIYDLGLLPRQVLSSKRNFFVRVQLARPLSPELQQALSPEEIEWLELGNFVELESFTPRRLLQVVAQGISRSQISSGDADSLFIEVDSDSSSSEAYLFASDSFG